MAMTVSSSLQLPCGTLGLQASKQGLGCGGMSGYYGKAISDDEGAVVINRAQELGVTMLDTASMYGWGKNEVLIGRAIQGNRDKFIIATKCGVVEKEGGGVAIDGSRQHVRTYCEASLKRLGVDYIDLLYLHRVDPKTPVEETFAEFKALCDEGKIRYAGISEASPDDIRRAHAVCPLSAVQQEWSLWSRDCEEDVIPTCRELGIGIVAYSPLGRGLLSGTIQKPEDMDADDIRHMFPRYQKGAIEQNMVLVDALKQMAARKGCTASQLALAWVHAQGDDVFPIPGTKRVKYLEENVAALDIKLSQEELRELERLFPHDKVKGERFADMKTMSHQYYKHV